MKVLSCVLCLSFILFIMPITAVAEITTSTEDIGNIVNDVIAQEGSQTQAPAETTYVTVTDEEGNPVTDEFGEVVTEVSIIEGSSETTTVPVTEMEGQFETRELSNDDLIALDRIRHELEEQKKNAFSDVFGVISAIAGIIVILYTMILLVAFLIDRLNILNDFECLRVVTINNAVTLRDEADRDIIKSENDKIYIMSMKKMIITLILGILLGVLLTKANDILYLIQYFYNTITS